MAEYSGFFNGKVNPDGTFDRVYLAKSFAAYFASFIGNGVFPTPDNGGLLVSASGNNVSVAPGKAYINGYWYMNDSVLPLSIKAYSGANRTDAIAVQWDDTARVVVLTVIENYTAPTRTGTRYELILATVQISASGITVTDTRAHDSLCGIVKTLISSGSDYDTLIAIIQTEIATRTSEDVRMENNFESTLANQYRNSVSQDIIDALKVSKNAFVHPQFNPNGYVLLWLQPNLGADSVSIDSAGYQPATGQFSPGTLALPMANQSRAGLMTKEQARSLSQVLQDVSAITAGAGFKEQWFDTRAELAASDVSNFVTGMPTIVWNDEGQGNATTKWQYSPDDTSGREKVNGFIYGGIAQEVPYTFATQSKLGLVLSESGVQGGVMVNTDGTMSVIGWDALNAVVDTIQAQYQLQLEYNQQHKHTGGADGAVLPKPWTIYGSAAEAQADTTDNLALTAVETVSAPADTPTNNLMNTVQFKTENGVVSINPDFEDSEPTEGSDHLITSGAVKSALDNYHLKSNQSGQVKVRFTGLDTTGFTANVDVLASIRSATGTVSPSPTTQWSKQAIDDNTTTYATGFFKQGTQESGDRLRENNVPGQVHRWRIAGNYTEKVLANQGRLRCFLTNPDTGFRVSASMVLPSGITGDDFTFEFTSIADSDSLGIGRGYKLGFATTFTDDSLVLTVNSIVRISEAIDPEL